MLNEVIEMFYLFVNIEKSVTKFNDTMHSFEISTEDDDLINFEL